uniref:Reverse transcriptase zinc-binding domain-containing protein n=1 Tax=Oryza brachyantha TaxID=4533 RepID=J3LYS2_ORYBR
MGLKTKPTPLLTCCLDSVRTGLPRIYGRETNQINRAPYGVRPLREEVNVIQGILWIFGDATGLRVNLSKSAVTPILCSEEQGTKVAAMLGCPIQHLPIVYLGLPLSSTRPRKENVQPILDKLSRKIAGWKPKWLAPDGRLKLIKSVLMALPLHFQSVLPLPMWAIKKIKRKCRGFLWKGQQEISGVHCLNRWPTLFSFTKRTRLTVRQGLTDRLGSDTFEEVYPSRSWRNFSKSGMKCNKSSLRKERIPCNGNQPMMVWRKLRTWINVDVPIPHDDDEDLTTWWCRARAVFRTRYRAAFDSLCLLTTWCLWKERNARTFDQVASTVDKIFNDIRSEVMIWREAGIFREGEG